MKWECLGPINNSSAGTVNVTDAVNVLRRSSGSQQRFHYYRKGRREGSLLRREAEDVEVFQMLPPKFFFLQSYAFVKVYTFKMWSVFEQRAIIKVPRMKLYTKPSFSASCKHSNSSVIVVTK